jgi:zinc/manganese transport system substrate-binding protein
MTLLFALFTMRANALINIVAAENIYGEVAKELGGPYVEVMNIINNPNQDPHLFTTTPSTAKAVNAADIVIYNGAEYDPWISSMLAIEGAKNRHIINVATLIHVKSGENPHLWYLPTTMPIFAQALVTTLTQLDPPHKQYYENQLNQFNHSYHIIFATIKRLKQQFQYTPVIATEPVFGYMAKSIGLTMHGEALQINIMNDSPPSISQIKSFEDDLTQHKVCLLIYNNQVINPLTKNMQEMAEKETIPIIGVSEMLPPNMTYVQWMMKELAELEHALKSCKQDLNG